MNRFSGAFALTTLLSAATLSAIEKPETVPLSGKVKWVYDYEEGKRLSRELGKPMFVVFRCER